MQTTFTMGQIVYLKADPSREGPVIAIRTLVSGRLAYRIFHSSGEVREYSAEQLAVKNGNSGLEQKGLAERTLLSANEFRARLTACRLANPLTDTLYALHAARIKFIPFQFKPLLRLLRSDRPRLLIADEVGVGKTIEAGLILKELQSRQKLETVLIVCPKALVTKWRAEMRRFDEDFHVLTPETLRYCLREAHLDGGWPVKYARAVAPLELLRNPDYLLGTTGKNPRPGLATMNPPVQFSLAIFDEAHHLRNSKTNSHQLARFVCDNTEATLFLSATPVQLGSKNLFSLLNLLRPDLFQNEGVFNEMVGPNPHITRAIRHIRSATPVDTWRQESAAELEQAAATQWGARSLASDFRFTRWRALLPATAEISRKDRVQCIGDLEELHTLAHVMNRTRRRDIGRFTVREPHTITVPFTAKQQEFYDELILFRCNVLSLKYDPIVIRLIVDMLERQAASCLPALIPTLRGFLRTGRFCANTLTDSLDDEEEGEHDLTEDLKEQARLLEGLALNLPSEDPKIAALLKIAKTGGEGGPRKLLVFSFFIHTLKYLETHLKNGGFRVGIITGQVPDEERERLRDRFRKSAIEEEALDILLSSEVGCEGLDYEFCDRMVNYDIPWNPMRLEQRIGRIDRFGQQSEKVLIFNFVTPGTVEERIFFRCFDRLGIFRDTVGDCEDVLGEQSIVEQLHEIARNRDLSPQQAEEKAKQLADNAARLLDQQNRLEAEGSSLLGLDQALTDEVTDIDAAGRFVSAEELRSMISFFLEQESIGGKLEVDKQNPDCDRIRLNHDARASLATQLRGWQPNDRALTEFRRWLDTGEPTITVTFNQKTALERRDLPFITPVHPLSRLASEALKCNHDPIATALRVQTNETEAGHYVFVCDLWETIAITPEIRLVSFVWSITRNVHCPDLSGQVMRWLMQTGSDQVAIRSFEHNIEAAVASLDDIVHEERQKALTNLFIRNDQLVSRKLASFTAYQENRLARIERELSTSSDDRIRRMKASEKSRAERDYAQRREEIERKRRADIVRHRVALGVMEVANG